MYLKLHYSFWSLSLRISCFWSRPRIHFFVIEELYEFWYLSSSKSSFSLFQVQLFPSSRQKTMDISRCNIRSSFQNILWNMSIIFSGELVLGTEIFQLPSHFWKLCQSNCILFLIWVFPNETLFVTEWTQISTVFASIFLCFRLSMILYFRTNYSDLSLSLWTGKTLNVLSKCPVSSFNRDLNI